MKAPRILPFVVQEAGPHFRGGRTFVLRALYLLVSGAALALTYEAVKGGESGALVRSLYQTFYMTSYVGLCLLAPVFTVRAVFRDKVSGLASVIASAPVTETDYVLGRMLGQVASLMAILAVGAPLFLALVFLHAATTGEVVKGFLLLALGGILSSSLSLGRAIEAETVQGAVFSSYALTLFPGCLTPLFWLPFFATEIDVPPWAWVYLLLATPVVLAYNLFRARVLFRRCFVAEGQALPPWQASQRTYRGPVGENPVLWWEATRARRFLEKNFGQADSLSAAVRILSGLAVAAALIPLCLHPVGVGLLFALGVLAAVAQAAACVAGEREAKVWDTLASTPLPPGRIAFGKLVGILQGLRLLWIASALGLGIHLVFSAGSGEMPILLAWAVAAVSAGALLLSLALHASCVSPTPGRALTRTLLFGIALIAPPLLLRANWGALPASLWTAFVLAWASAAGVLLWTLPARMARAATGETPA